MGTTETLAAGVPARPGAPTTWPAGPAGGGRRGRRRGHRAGRLRQRRRRLDPHPGGVVRRRRAQAVARTRDVGAARSPRRSPAGPCTSWSAAQRARHRRPARLLWPGPHSATRSSSPRPDRPFLARSAPRSSRCGSACWSHAVVRARRRTPRSRRRPSDRGAARRPRPPRRGGHPAVRLGAVPAGHDRRVGRRRRAHRRRLRRDHVGATGRRRHPRGRHARRGRVRPHGDRRPARSTRLEQANHVARRMGWFFATYDVLLTPTLGRPAGPAEHLRPARAHRAARDVRDLVAVGVVPAGVQRHRPAGHQPAAAPERGGPADRHAAGRACGPSRCCSGWPPSSRRRCRGPGGVRRCTWRTPGTAVPGTRRVTLVLSTLESGVLGALPPFDVPTPWWSDAAGVVAVARSVRGRGGRAAGAVAARRVGAGWRPGHLPRGGRRAPDVPWPRGPATRSPTDRCAAVRRPGGPGRPAWAERCWRGAGPL